MRLRTELLIGLAAAITLPNIAGCGDSASSVSGSGGMAQVGGSGAAPSTGGETASGGTSTGGAASGGANATGGSEAGGNEPGTGGTSSGGMTGSGGTSGEGGSELNTGCTPQFELRLEDTGSNGQLFVTAVGNDAQASVIDIGRHVCRILYRKTSELLPITKLTLIIRDDPGVAWKSGNGSEITVMISSRHLRNVHDSGGDAAVAEEVKGILYHEMTHMYQYDDRNNPTSAESGEGAYTRLGNAIEGVADFVRFRAGYMPRGRTPSKTGRWDDQGYTKPAFFLLWADTQYPGFLYRLNLTMAAGDGRSWEPSWAFPEVADGKTEAELWSEFQAAACCSGDTQTCCK